jgi:hypothetical protein
VFTRWHKIRVYKLGRVRIRAESGAPDNLGLKIDHRGIDAIVDNSNFDWRDFALIFLRSVFEEAGERLDAFDPRRVPALSLEVYLSGELRKGSSDILAVGGVVEIR